MELDGGSIKGAVQTDTRSGFSPFLVLPGETTARSIIIQLQAEHKTQFCINFIFQQ